MRNPETLLITGGCGFIGSALIRYLLERSDFQGRIVNLDALTYAANPDNVARASEDPRYRFIQGDIRDRELVLRLCRDRAVEAIIHCAAESHVDRSIHAPDAFIHTNVVGTFELLEVVRELPHIHLHHVSTDEVFGSLGPSGAFMETTPYAPRSPYAASKAASDHLVRAYAHTYGLSVTLSNSCNNYGPFQFPEKLLPLMITNMLEHEPLPIYGDGSQVRDWLHVDDHAEALWLIVRRGERGESYNVGSRAERTNLALLEELIEIVADCTGEDPAALRALITFVADRPGHDQRYAIDPTKIERDLGWSPRYDLRRGLRETVRWYRDNQAWVERTKSGAYRDWIDTNYTRRGDV